MRKVAITIDPEGVMLSVIAIVGGICLYTAFAPSMSLLSRLFQNNIKDACTKYKEEMTAHGYANPVITGNYNDFSDPAFREWNIKGDEINKRLFNTVGINYISSENRSIEEAQINVAGLMKAAQECYNVGVDLGGMKEIKEFSKGLK